MPDTLTLIGLVAVVAAVLFFALYRPRVIAAARPGRALIEHMEELGRNGAGRVMEEKLGAHKAKEFVNDFGAAFSTDAPATPGPKS